MKRLIPLAISVVLVATACTDKPVAKTVTTAPAAPRLTRSTLTSDASTVCVASVSARDEVLATPAVGAAAADRQRRLDALDAVVDDTCQ